MEPEIRTKVPVITIPSPAEGEPHLMVGFLAAHGKWKTQCGPVFTASMRYEGCVAQKCSQNKDNTGFSPREDIV